MPNRFAEAVRAPELPDGYVWFNSPPLTLPLPQPRGKLVILDFWTSG